MRIPLADDRGRRNRPARLRRSKDRRGQTFDTALPMPRVPAAGRGARRAPARSEPAKPAKESGRRSRVLLGKRQAVSVQPAQAPARAATSTRLLRWAAFLFLALLVGAVVYGSTDARFFVYQAGVVGARHLTAEAIYQAAGIHEQNIFWIDPGTVARRIAGLDGIKVARVRCALPAALTIEVEERQPKVMWRTGGHDWWLDEEGIVLPYHGDAHAADVVFVVDATQRQLTVGQSIEPDGVVASVLRLAAAVPQSRVFFYDAERGLSFTQKGLAGEWPVYVGSSEDLPLKIQVMQTLTGYLEKNGIMPRYVDVRWAAHPVYGRPFGEPAAGGQ